LENILLVIFSEWFIDILLLEVSLPSGCRICKALWELGLLGRFGMIQGCFSIILSFFIFDCLLISFFSSLDDRNSLGVSP
jgi:hypothetical protein